MAYFPTKNPNLGKFFEGFAVDAVGLHILWLFGALYGYLVYFVAIRYIFWLFGTFLLFWYVLLRIIWQPWDRCYDFFNIFAEKFSKKMHF
jgi:hypothetical protein